VNASRGCGGATGYTRRPDVTATDSEPSPARVGPYSTRDANCSRTFDTFGATFTVQYAASGCFSK